MFSKIRKSRIILLLAAVVIIVVGIFFAKQLLLGNPIQGKWSTMKGDYYLIIEDDNEAELVVLIEDKLVEMDIQYEMDKKTRMITFLLPTTSMYDEAVEEFDGKVSVAELSDKVEVIFTSFEYSMEQDTLTLTEREYGEQMIFKRVK